MCISIYVYIYTVYIYMYMFTYIYMQLLHPEMASPAFFFRSAADIKLAEEDQGGFKARSHLRGETNQPIKHPMLHPMLYLQALAVPRSEMFVGL